MHFIMYSFFGIIYLNLIIFNTTNDANMNYMFAESTSLVSLNLSSFVTSNNNLVY